MHGRGGGRGLFESVYTWSNTSIKEKMGLSAGGLIGREVRLIGFHTVLMVTSNDLSHELFAIFVSTAINSSLKHCHKNFL